MKIPTLIGTFVCILAVNAFTQDVQMTDYRVPISSACSLLTSLDGNFSGIGDSTVANNGNFKIAFKKFYTSLPFSWRLDFNGAGSKVGSQETYAFNFAGGVNKYFSKQGDWFGFGRLQGSHLKGFEQVQSRISAGIGYGRFISATAFAKAIRIENFWLKEGVITGHLDKESLVELGNIVEKEQEYKDKYGATYEPKWYDDMEKVAKKSGKLTGDGLGAIGILRTKEVLFFETVQERFYGWTVRAGMGYDITTADKSSTDPSAEFGLSFAYPISLSSQINHDTQYNTSLGDIGKEFTIISSTDFIYELSNRVDFVLGYLMQSTKFDANAEAFNSHVLRASFIFFIENQINLLVTAQLDKKTGLAWQRSLTFGVGYRLF